MSDPLTPASPTLEGREETPQAGRPMPADTDWAVISAIRHELWQASQGRGYGEDRTLVGMVRRVITERDEARENRKGEYELRSSAEKEVAELRASLTAAQAEIERLKADAETKALHVEIERLKARSPVGWYCSCGWPNGINLAECACCSRRPGGPENPCTLFTADGAQ